MSRLGGGDCLSDRLHSSLTLGNKPDTKPLSDPGSPVSPLRTRPAASSSSSSSGSFGKAQNPGKRSDTNSSRKSYSGELSGSRDSSPTVKPRPGHRRSGSGPLVYTGTGNNSSSTASSPVTNVLPAGNICPSGRIGKTGAVARAAARSDVLGSGTGNYGHGSIMRGGTGSVSGGKLSTESTRAMGAAMDPQEVTRLGNEWYKKGNFSEALRFYDRAVEIYPGNAACRNNRAAALTGLGRLAEAVKECEEAVRLDPEYGRAHHRLALLHLR